MMRKFVGKICSLPFCEAKDILSSKDIIRAASEPLIVNIAAGTSFLQKLTIVWQVCNGQIEGGGKIHRLKSSSARQGGK
jgi:hypothetical protein